MKNVNNKKLSNSELIPFNLSKLNTLQYIKIVFAGNNKDLYELQADSHSINNKILQLFITQKEKINVTCPTGVMLKLVTKDAIYFAKTVLKEILNVNGKFIFILNTPKQIIRQQNRKHYRINIERPCVLMINNDKGNNQTFIARTINISKGGALICNAESMLNDEQPALNLVKGESCYIALFLEISLIIKTSAMLVRAERADDSYRYAFQFTNIPQKYITSFYKYLTKEEFKLLQTIKYK